MQLTVADRWTLSHQGEPYRAYDPDMLVGRAREQKRICELLDGLRSFPSLLVVASTSRPDGIGSLLIAPGRLDHLIEVPLPDEPALREILEIPRKRAEALAERSLFEPFQR